MFCACSRIRSTSTLISTTARAIPTSALLLPTVFVFARHLLKKKSMRRPRAVLPRRAPRELLGSGSEGARFPRPRRFDPRGRLPARGVRGPAASTDPMRRSIRSRSRFCIATTASGARCLDQARRGARASRRGARAIPLQAWMPSRARIASRSRAAAANAHRDALSGTPLAEPSRPRTNRARPPRRECGTGSPGAISSRNARSCLNARARARDRAWRAAETRHPRNARRPRCARARSARAPPSPHASRCRRIRAACERERRETCGSERAELHQELAPRGKTARPPRRSRSCSSISPRRGGRRSDEPGAEHLVITQGLACA